VHADTRTGRAAQVFKRYALSVLWVGVAAWFEWLIAHSRAGLLSLTPFGLAIGISGCLGGFGPGALAVLLSAIALNVLMAGGGPFLTFHTPTDAFVFVVFCAGWLAFCLVVDRIYRRAERDRRERHAAHHARTQAERIAQLTDALSRARTPEAVMEAAVQEPLHAFAADAALLSVVGPEDEPLQLVRAVGYRNTERDARAGSALSGHSPARDAITRGALVTIETLDAYAKEYPEHVHTPAAEGFRALAAVPLLAGSRPLAVVQLEFRLPRPFTKDDRYYLSTLGVRAAQALERAWQLDSAVRAKQDADALRARADEQLLERHGIEQALRTSETRYRSLAARTGRLHALAAALSEAVTLEAVAHAIVTHGRLVTGATNGEAALLMENGSVFETLYSDAPSHDRNSWSRYRAEPGLCATVAIETREPVLISSFEEWQERYSRSAAIAADGGFVSSATLPLLAEGRAIGVLMLHFTAPVNFDDEYRSLLISVAQHSAQALDRARLYETTQQAKAEAETANRLKDDFVSIISHELRTPLNAMLGWTAMLRKGSLDATTASRALQSIHDNATRQARLLDELLDFSRLRSGRLSLDIESFDLRRLLHDVVESMIPSAAARNIDLDLAPTPPVQLRGDPRRLEQVFFNVLGNALKFTDNGGRVTIRSAVSGDIVHVRVTDTGAGIEPGFLPYVFERFRQGERATSRRYGGVGLGLSIARELVEAHGGRITAESEGAGRGATFIIALPVESAPVQGDAGPDGPPPAEPSARVH
jgi:signal transduction histidine kinase